LAAFRSDCLLIEIASAPFGIAADDAKMLGLPYIYAPALPGKTAPKTAGEIIADTVDSILKEFAYE
jgi:dipicolinate synthase subunit A